MADKALLRLHRVTELFETGREMIISDRDAEPVLVWIAKLNTFQRGDAQRDASAVRARRVAGLSDDSDEMRAIKVRLATMTQDQKLEFILAPKESQAYLSGHEDVRADPEWKDRIQLMERSESLITGGNPPTDKETEALITIQQDYAAAVEAAAAERMKEFRHDFEGVKAAELDEQYLDVARSNLGSNAFFEEFQRCELFYALRDCEAKRKKGGDYDHTSCTHQRLLPSKAAINDLPEDFIERIKNVISDNAITPGEAGNSDAPANSSESSGQQNSAEASPSSTQTET
jgi:hypothetical protein